MEEKSWNPAIFAHQAGMQVLRKIISSICHKNRNFDEKWASWKMWMRVLLRTSFFQHRMELLSIKIDQTSVTRFCKKKSGCKDERILGKWQTTLMYSAVDRFAFLFWLEKKWSKSTLLLVDTSVVVHATTWFCCENSRCQQSTFLASCFIFILILKLHCTVNYKKPLPNKNQLYRGCANLLHFFCNKATKAIKERTAMHIISNILNRVWKIMSLSDAECEEIVVYPCIAEG